MTARRAIVAVCMPERGHVQRLLPVVEGLTARGHPTYVLSDTRFAPAVARAGATPLDLFAGRPLAAADATSLPIPSRYVSFAAAYAEPLTAEVAALAPALVLYDTFAVVAPIVARRLGVPYVNVCAGHAAVPERTAARLREDPRVATSAACQRAVRRLREVHGIANASPFSYVDNASPFLNVYGEPREFLDACDRAALEPLVFFGSLAPAARDAAAGAPPFPSGYAGVAVYVAFGTVIWRYYEAEALAALTVLADVLATRDARAVITLGGHALDGARRDALARDNVRVETYADQWAALRRADVFVTHHGLNSTHEAIFHRVPMLSYPFAGDQLALARRCQELGIAVALAPAPRAPLAPADVERALRRVRETRADLAARLAEVRAWELATINGREGALDRILALI